MLRFTLRAYRRDHSGDTPARWPIREGGRPNRDRPRTFSASPSRSAAPELVEPDRQPARTRAQVHRLMGGDRRAVRASEAQTEGRVINEVLLVIGLAKPGRE